MSSKTNLGELISKSEEIGDIYQKSAIKDKNVQHAKIANIAYNNAIRGAVAKLQYKKLIGDTSKEDLFK